MSEFEAVLFDAGDTLIRLTGSGETLLHRAADDLGVAPLDPSEVADVWKRVLDRSSTAEEMAKGRDLSEAKHHDVWTALYVTAGIDQLAPGLAEALYARTVAAESWEAFEDTVPTLRTLSERGTKIGIVSDTGFDITPALAHVGALTYVDTVVMSFQHGMCKPAAPVFLAACDQLEADPARTLFVGDNPLTDSGAIAVGMHAFLLPRATPTGPRGLAHVLSLV